jgi:hypothetical protein
MILPEPEVLLGAKPKLLGNLSNLLGYLLLLLIELQQKEIEQ